MIEIKENIPLSDFSTFKIGGPARFFGVIQQPGDASWSFQWAAERAIKTLVIGKGSNSLFDSRGFNGLVLLNKLSFVDPIFKNQIRAGSGASFPLLGTRVCRQGYSGLEFAAGIPATVGGAVYMNAGASKSDIASCLDSVRFIDMQGSFREYKVADLKLGYRTSLFQSLSGFITDATFNLTKDDQAKDLQQQIVEYRYRTQPYNMPSCGCIFRNSSDVPSSKLIDELGLKGFSIGGAQISTLQANFIVNKGEATSNDVLALIEHVKAKAMQERGVLLEEELRVISYD